MKLSVNFINRDNLYMPHPGRLQFNVSRFTKSALGGPKTASINVIGDLYSLLELTRWLRYSVYISDSRGDDVWWGYLDAVDIYTSGLRLSVNLNNMWNSVKVQYTSGTTSTTTSAGTHALSVSTYGTKEITVSASDVDNATAAEAMRDRLVEFYGLPRVERTPSTGGEAYATLTCAGWWNTLSWQYYTNAGTDSVATTAQISDIVTAAGPLLTGTTIVDASAITTLETRDGSQRAQDEIIKMLEIGVSGGNRLNAVVDKFKRLVVSSEYDTLFYPYMYNRGIIYDRFGAIVDPSNCPAGVWMTVNDNNWYSSGLPTIITDPGRIFVEESEYDVATNTWTPTPRGSYMPGGLL